MDAESLIPKQAPEAGDESSSSTLSTETKHQRKSTVVAFVQFLCLSVVLLGCASLGAYLSNHQADDVVPQRQVGALVVDEDDSSYHHHSMHAWSVGKKIHPPHPKKLHHGEVLYKTVEDPTQGRYYQRSFIIPCGYGILVVNIGPASKDMPYDFDVYDDGYAYSNNGGLCIFYPSYKAHQEGNDPFWMPSDPTSFRVPLGDKLSKISTKINEHPHTKDFSNPAEKTRGGDYLVMTKGDFYTPQYYRELKQMVNTWKADEVDKMGGIDEMLLQAIEQIENSGN